VRERKNEEEKSEARKERSEQNRKLGEESL
jgi:hypothetical protein